MCEINKKNFIKGDICEYKSISRQQANKLSKANYTLDLLLVSLEALILSDKPILHPYISQVVFDFSQKKVLIDLILSIYYNPNCKVPEKNDVDRKNKINYLENLKENI